MESHGKFIGKVWEPCNGQQCLDQGDYFDLETETSVTITD